MLKSKYEIFLETDIIKVDLSVGTITENVLLSKCLSMFDCYTSVINASEIFSYCLNKREIELAKKSFSGINVLGIPFRYSLKIGEIFGLIKKKILTILTEMRLFLQCARKQNYHCFVQIL